MSSASNRWGYPKGEGSDSNVSTEVSGNVASTEEARLAEKVVTALDFNSGLVGATTSSKKEMQKEVPQPFSTPLSSSGAYRSPGELGVLDSTAQTPDEGKRARPSLKIEKATPASWSRSMRVIQSTMSPAAAAAAAATVRSMSKETESEQPAMVCALAYRGMEVAFATVCEGDEWTVVCICSRTRVALQTLDLPESSERSSRIVSLAADPVTGMVTVAMSDGAIQTYVPVETSPGPTANPAAVVSAFGRFRWMNGATIHSAEVFYRGTKAGHAFNDMKSGTGAGSVLDISSSADYKVLVAHRNQLAVFDATPVDVSVPVVNVGPFDSEESVLASADLLWTIVLHADIVTARLSGDGHAIAVVLKGEGDGTPDPYGARTFLRDRHDGSNLPVRNPEQTTNKPGAINDRTRQSSTASSVGIVYKPGPFLIHSTSVTRLSFRGLGHVTSNVHSFEDEGNDLLLTYCAGDCSARIFSQNSWKRLMHWTTPPSSRADWVRGITAFTLGDLEGKKTKSASSRSISRRPSFGSGIGDDSSGASGGINRNLLGARPFSSVASNAASPSSAAGAWIAELTFRDALPALRLSRLSYIKRSGSDAQPAHFESVAAILPAGSLIASTVLEMDDMGLSIQGIWPSWNPWLAATSGAESNGTLSGSAMALLGLPTSSVSSGGAFGSSNWGGTHSPPSELRLVASHPLRGQVVLMEFPLWGDHDFGAMELGSPLRFVLSLREPTIIRPPMDTARRSPLVCVDHESSRLCARIDPGSTSVALTWRKPGAMYILPGDDHSKHAGLFSGQSIASTRSADSKMSHHSFSSLEGVSGIPEPYMDVSVFPLPLCLPSLQLPASCISNNEAIVAVLWLPDDNFGGPPQLVVVTSIGSIVLYEMPPPWSALEPSMPSYDPFDMSTTSSMAGGDNGFGHTTSQDLSDDDSDRGSFAPKEYETMVTPHADFGIGLRLESQADGMPAIAGSYKKNPLTGGRLPAERTGMIVLGDELLSVNGVSLEGMSFDEIIATVREVGAESKPDAPLRMRFRTKPSNRRKRGGSESLGNGSNSSHGNSRRTIEQMLGVSPKRTRRKGSTTNDDDSDTHVSMLVGAECEIQQEFGRVVAVVRSVLEIDPQDQRNVDVQQRFLLLPWKGESGSSDRGKQRSSLLLYSCMNTLHAFQLEVGVERESGPASFTKVGALSMEDEDGKTIGSKIRSITEVKTGDSSFCVAVCAEDGTLTLVTMDIETRHKSKSIVDDPSLPAPSIEFQCYRAFNCSSELSSHENVLVRASSVNLIATTAIGGGRREVSVWCALPQPSERECDDDRVSDYSQALVRHNLLPEGVASSDHSIVDVRFVSSGKLDAFPWIVTFSSRSAVVHRRGGGSYSWVPLAEITFGSLPGSKPDPSLALGSSYVNSRGARRPLRSDEITPSDFLPHLIPALREIISASDENHYLKSDWHPDSMLAYICTEKAGAQRALKTRIRGIFSWLSRWTSPDDETTPYYNSRFPLSVAPISSVIAYDDDSSGIGDDAVENVDSAANLMATFSLTPRRVEKPESEDVPLLRQLQNVLRPGQEIEKQKNKFDSGGGKSKDFLLTMGLLNDDTNEVQDSNAERLPPPLESLYRDEIRMLWATGEILAKPSKFKNLDAAAQLTVFCTLLMRQLQEAENDKEKDERMDRPSSLEGSSKPDNSRWNSFFKKPSQTQTSEMTPNPTIASAACISALISDCQGALIDACRIENKKMDWPTVRSLRLPLWLRSDGELKKIAEEIGQSIYKDTRDVMESALFFVAVRNIRTLRNLAATDQSVTGKTLLKFLTSHDFASQRGRKAAEKNAYSLLRKRRYGVAASFFLLSEPPMLKTALEVIVTQMEDLDLAFMIARLVDHTCDPKNSLGKVTVGGNTLGGAGFGGMMGGGGGFAATAPTMKPRDHVKFRDWKPVLGPGARTLIEERGLDLAGSDFCLKTIQLIWLGRPEESRWSLSGLSAYQGTSAAALRKETFVPHLFDTARRDARLPQDISSSANSRVLHKANTIINFCSGPFLLDAMRAHARERWASALLVSRALTRRGIEIPAMHVLQQFADPGEKEAAGTRAHSRDAEGQPPAAHPETAPPSIFDNFDLPPRREKKGQLHETEGQSIFSSFDAPPGAQAKSQPSHSSPSESSIFDSFDAAPRRKPTQASTSTAESSIFDSFDAPPKKSKPPEESRKAQSSIFDAFETPQSTKRSVVQHTSNQGLESSIFDEFVGPKSKVSEASDTQVGNSKASNNGNIILEQKTATISPLARPQLWTEWREEILISSCARRFLRDLSKLVSRFHGDAMDTSMQLFKRHINPLVPNAAAEILRTHCDGEALLSSARKYLRELCSLSGLEESQVLWKSLQFIGGSLHQKRIVFAVVIYTMMDRADLAEDVIRDASHDQMLLCDSSALVNDDLVRNRKTVSHIASQYLRRKASRQSWQLELCLWLHRGGSFPLSVLALKEAVIAIRVGLFVASWGRSHECLEKMIRCEPDCEMDFRAGHQLWTGLKIIASSEEKMNKNGGTTSGGWEFLVDCSREEATEILRQRSPGSFIIRPHAEDHGVFTLSFKTNLTPSANPEPVADSVSDKPPIASSPAETGGRPPKPTSSRPVKKDEVVQHAIIRLSDSGFRCGSFGPFSSLMKLLEAVSASLPFPLLFNEPPIERIIKDQGAQPSPNSLFFRKLALMSHSDARRWNNVTRVPPNEESKSDDHRVGDSSSELHESEKSVTNGTLNIVRRRRYGMFSLLLTLTEVRRTLSAIAACDDYSVENTREQALRNDDTDQEAVLANEESSFGSISYASEVLGEEELYRDSSRILRSFLNWCRALEVSITNEMAPSLDTVTHAVATNPVALAASETAIEVAPTDVGSCIDGGDAVIRQLIQPESGVDFRTLRVGEGGDSAMLVLFSKNEATDWFVSTNTEKTREDAVARLEMMERRRVVEMVELEELGTEHEVRYRFVDPWEVEALETKEGETMAAALGREYYYEFSVGRVERSCESLIRSLGGLNLLSLWTSCKGGICLTKAIASVHPPWERDAGGDLQMRRGAVTEPSPYLNTIRQHLYRNALFRRLKLPQRFLALVQVELLDLKNLTSPGGAASLSVYALLRLKRMGSGAPLSLKARTLDSACTQPTKIGKSSGPNAPASWGSLVRFRFPLPEDVNCDGISFDGDREALFKGPPCALQVSVYEKKFMKDIFLGGADVKLDALAGGGQLEEWVPLRSAQDEIHWFARIRLTLRFELMCLESEEDIPEDRPPSVGLRKIQQLSQLGGAHEDVKGMPKSMSTPDLLGYFESMVY